MYVIHPGIFLLSQIYNGRIRVFFMLDPASKGNIVEMIREMTTAF
jgi:hypothetical protein